MENFKITGIKCIKFLDSKGNEIKDLRDREPVLKETNLDTPIIDLILHHTTMPMEWTNKEPFINYGDMRGSSVYEYWQWDEDKLKQTSETILWKMFGLCSQYWQHQYEYWHHKEQKEFRDYRRNKGEDLDNWNLESSNFDICDNHPINLRIFGNRDEK